MHDYILPKTGETGRMTVLHPADIEDVVALHETVRTNAKNGFLQPQPREYFERLLAGRGGLMIGIRARDDRRRGPGALVAQLALAGPVTLDEAVGRSMMSLRGVSFGHAGLAEHVYIVKSKGVHPDKEGNRLSSHLLGFAQEQAERTDTAHLFAQITLSNLPSWISFARSAYAVVAAGRDPVDGIERMILQRPVGGFAFTSVEETQVVDPVAAFGEVDHLTRECRMVGTLITGIRDGGHRLAFRRPLQSGRTGRIDARPRVTG